MIGVDASVRRHLINDARETHYPFNALLQHHRFPQSHHEGACCRGELPRLVDGADALATDFLRERAAVLWHRNRYHDCGGGQGRDFGKLHQGTGGVAGRTAKTPFHRAPHHEKQAAVVSSSVNPLKPPRTGMAIPVTSTIEAAARLGTCAANPAPRPPGRT